MQYSIYLVLAAAGLASAVQVCTGTSVEENGNYFCSQTDHLLYDGLGSEGSYKAVTNMGVDGVCSTEDVSYNGGMAPLDQDLSIHIRGPFKLKEAAVYYVGTAEKKRNAVPAPHVHAQRHGRGHGHQHLHKEKRADWVTATIDGQVVSWENDYFGGAAPTAAPPAPAPAPAPVDTAPAEKAPEPSSKPETVDDSETTDDAPAAAAGSWSRVAYYNAESQVADNMVFLGNYGGQGSGLWDTIWGGSLAYLNADGNGGSDSSQILKDKTIPSNNEFAIFSSEKCDDSCGYSRDPEVAYKGFTGSNKIFLFNFQMPLDGNRDFNGDMPALWLLNGRVPRTQQYGDCSCWTSGCGEADIIEVLASGDTKCKSTFHLSSSKSIGSSDWFPRPVDGLMKVAVVFDESAGVAIKVLDGVDFAEGLDAETVQSWIQG